MKTKLTLLVVLFCFSLTAQNEYWALPYTGNTILNFVPYGSISANATGVQVYSTLGQLDITGLGRTLSRSSLPGGSAVEANFYVDEHPDFTLVGHAFKLMGVVTFDVLSPDQSEVLYEIDLSLNVDPDLGYPVAVYDGNNVYYVFVDDTIVAFEVTTTGFTELFRFEGPGPATDACSIDGTIYASYMDGTIRLVQDDVISPPLYTHDGAIHTILPLEDELVFAGSTNDKNSWAKISLDGSLLFSETYDQATGQQIATTANGDFLLTGSRANGLGYVSKIDKSGNELWTYTQMSEPGVAVAEGSYGDVYALGLKTASGDANTVLVKLDRNGETGDLIPEHQSFPLAVNNIEANISSEGIIFLDDDQDASYIYPKGSGKATIFASGLWMAGMDPGGNLHLAAQGYAGDRDYAMGPIDADPSFFTRIWSVKKEYIEKFKTDIADGVQNEYWLNDIMDWPAKGNLIRNAAGEEFLIETDLAPFVDANGDGNYNPFDGDYPKIKGDQMLWWIFNDDKLHEQTNANELKVEVKASLFAYDCNGNELLPNTSFLDFEVENKSTENYAEFKFGYWVDADLGCYEDDYIGSLPAANAAFYYNQDALDGSPGTSCPGGVLTYGDMIPVQTITMLERPLESFMYYNNNAVGGPQPQGTTDPASPIEYYNYMTSKWRDGTPLTLGGSGYDPTSGATTNVAFPDNPSAIGGWSQCEENSPIGDRRTILTVGESDFVPGSVKRFQIALTTFPDVNHPCPDMANIESALDDLQVDIDQGALDFNLDLGPDITVFGGDVLLDAGFGAASYQWSDNSAEQTLNVNVTGSYSVTITTHFGCTYSDEIFVDLGVATNDVFETFGLNIYPNPASDFINIDFDNAEKLAPTSLEIFNITGQLMLADQMLNKKGRGKNLVNTQGWPSGIYLLKFSVGEEILVERVMVE